MSQKTYKQQSTRTLLPEIESKDILNLIIPNSVIEKIQRLCLHIPEHEWSGILLYNTEGSIKTPNTFEIIAKDIIPMNKGDKTFTGFAWNETKRDGSENEDRHIDYLNEHDGDEPLFYSLGMIHSHNSMDVFFSPEDVEELHDNAPNHNLYVSLIVNNRNEFAARVAYVIKAEIKGSGTFTALDQNGEEYELEAANATIIQKRLVWHKCNIIHGEITPIVESFFERNMREIIQKAESKPTNRQTFYGGEVKEKPKNPFLPKSVTVGPKAVPKLDKHGLNANLANFTLGCILGDPSVSNRKNGILSSDLAEIAKMAPDEQASIIQTFNPNLDIMLKKWYPTFFATDDIYDDVIDLYEDMLLILDYYADRYPLVKSFIKILEERLEKEIEKIREI